MTTPENFRRRQRIEGALLVILGVISLGTAYYYENESRQSRECFERTLSEVIAANERGRDAAQVTLSSLDTVVFGALSGRYQTEADVKKARAEYLADKRKAARLRAEAPLPPDPQEVCQ